MVVSAEFERQSYFWALFNLLISTMSDREGLSGAPGNDDDLSLPKATVAKMITGLYLLLLIFRSPCSSFVELLPKDVVCAKETRDLVIECCVGEQSSC